MTQSLVVFDLDSVVLHADGSVSDADRAAIAGARSAGVTVGFASSRRAPSAAAQLRALALDGWVIGCDGAQVARSADDRVLCRHTLPSTVAARIADTLAVLDLPVLAITVEGVHGPAQDEAPAREALGPIADAYVPRWPRLADISAMIGLGGRASEAFAALETLAPTRIVPVVYDAGPSAAIRVNALRASRARAIFDLAARLGIRKTRVAYAGGTLGGWCDTSGLERVSRVFCPADVPRARFPHAERLACDAGRGAIAETLERWIAAAPPLAATSA